MRDRLPLSEPPPERLRCLHELAGMRVTVREINHWRSDDRLIVKVPVKTCDLLLMVLDGELDAGVGGRAVRVATGQALLAPAGEPHRARRSRTCATVTVCTLHAVVHDRHGAPLLTRWRNPLLHCPAEWTGQLLALRGIPDRALRDRLVEPCLRALLLAQAGSDLLLPAAANTGRLAGLLALMEERLAEPLDGQALAGFAGLSAAHLREVFRHHLGCTPHRHLVRLRVRRADDLLRGGATVAAAAAAVGFRSVRGLRLAFHHELGCAPGARRWED